MNRLVPPARVNPSGSLSSTSIEWITFGEVFVTVRVMLTSSSAIDRVGLIFLSTEIGICLGFGSAMGMNRRTAIGTTKSVSHGDLKPRLRKMKA